MECGAHCRRSCSKHDSQLPRKQANVCSPQHSASRITAPSRPESKGTVIHGVRAVHVTFYPTSRDSANIPELGLPFFGNNPAFPKPRFRPAPCSRTKNINKPRQSHRRNHNRHLYRKTRMCCHSNDCKRHLYKRTPCGQLGIERSRGSFQSVLHSHCSISTRGGHIQHVLRRSKQGMVWNMREGTR